MQPGDTITPHGAGKPDDSAKAAVTPDVQKPAAESAQPDNSQDAPLSESQNQAQPATDASSPWQYAPEENTAANTGFHAQLEPVTWTASEFVENEKNAGWFLAFAGIAVVAVLMIYFITQDLVTVVVVAIAALLFAVTAKRKPRTLQYRLDEHGIQIDKKTFPYETFKSFSVLEEGAFNSIQLMPLKRFMPPISLYFPPESEDRIVNTLGSYLPHEERTHDPIDRLMRRVRF